MDDVLQMKLLMIQRCFFDARHGRFSLSFERMEDLVNMFPDDAQVWFSQGMLLLDYLGQGIKSRELFEKAYSLDSSHKPALTYATRFSRNEEEFRKWAEISLIEDPNGEGFNQFKIILDQLNKGKFYSEILFNLSEVYFGDKRYADSAAYMELALLNSDSMAPDEKVRGHRGRAESLIALNSEAHMLRESFMEASLIEEHGALELAIKELDMALSDEYGAYDLNLWLRKSAMCDIIGRFEESIICANHAIDLQPFDNPDPWEIKAGALWKLHRDSEALSAAKEELKQAEKMHSTADIARAQDAMKIISTPRQTPSIADIEPASLKILNIAKKIMDEEMAESKMTVNQVSSLMNQCTDIRMRYILSTFSPETVYFAMMSTNMNIYAQIMDVVLRLVLTSRGAMKRDAARLIILSLFEASSGQAIRSLYRQVIVNNPDLQANERLSFREIVDKELKRFDFPFLELITSAPTEDELLQDKKQYYYPNLKEKRLYPSIDDELQNNQRHIGIYTPEPISIHGIIFRICIFFVLVIALTKVIQKITGL